MRTLRFSTGTLPPEQRLPLFQAGARAYTVAAIGDPLGFAADWRVVPLGDVNIVHAHITPVSYQRTRARIAADGENRVAFFHLRQGSGTGTLNDVAVATAPGGAMIWDLCCPLDLRSETTAEVEIVTLPRFMIDEVMPAGIPLAGTIAPSPALTLVVEHLRFLLDHAGDLPDQAAPFQGRALRDMVVMAMHPIVQAHRSGESSQVEPVLQRILDRIDRDPAGVHDMPGLANALALPAETVAATLARFGGFDMLVEQRRLLAAYRLLSDPAETDAISVIAARCGFTDMPRFSRRFRAVFHTTATDLRQHHRAHLPVWAGAYHLEQSYGALMMGEPR